MPDLLHLAAKKNKTDFLSFTHPKNWISLHNMQYE